LPNGWNDVTAAVANSGVNKFSVINVGTWSDLMTFLGAPYTLMGGVLGGTFLSMASHGTDQLLVQRLLGCKSKRESQKALVLDASFIVLQFAFFLVLGVCLFTFYGGASLAQLGLKSSDEIFPKFIIDNLPTGVAGLVVAGVLASAMGTLSSSISSLASSSYLDLFRLTKHGSSIDAASELCWSKFFTLLWGVILIGGAMLFTDTKNPVVELGLKIASFTYGGLLGTFFLGLLFKRTSQRDAFAGFIAGLAVMTFVLSKTNIDFTWHTFIGCAATLIVGNFSRIVRSRISRS